MKSTITNKHAYCIIAHNDPYCLKSLLTLLDDERNDIFIIFDKKTNRDLFNLVGVNICKSTLYVVPYSQLVDIRWGNLSQVRAELLGFSFVLEHGDYSYIHLISGVDLPIKSQDYIHDYFDKLPSGTNMIGFDNKDYSDRTRYYHVLGKYRRSRNIVVKLFCDVVRIVFLKLQKTLGFKRNWSNLKPYKGTNWVSITTEFASYLVSNKDFILKQFKGVYCADEVYKQTMIMNSDFKETVFDMSLNLAGNTRVIDWNRGKPYVWRECDYDLLKNTEGLFARKFNSYVDKTIIDKIVSLVKSQS